MCSGSTSEGERHSGAGAGATPPAIGTNARPDPSSDVPEEDPEKPTIGAYGRAVPVLAIALAVAFMFGL